MAGAPRGEGRAGRDAGAIPSRQGASPLEALRALANSRTERVRHAAPYGCTPSGIASGPGIGAACFFTAISGSSAMHSTPSTPSAASVSG